MNESTSGISQILDLTKLELAESRARNEKTLTDLRIADVETYKRRQARRPVLEKVAPVKRTRVEALVVLVRLIFSNKKKGT